jgi:hypothetical protein
LKENKEIPISEDFENDSKSFSLELENLKSENQDLNLSIEVILHSLKLFSY